MTVEELIKEKGKSLSSSAYVVPDIPEKKLNNAIVGMTESTVEPEYVVAVIDTTLFGKSDDGFLFTGEAMYWHPSGSRRVIVKFSELKAAEIFVKKETDSKGKVKETKLLRVIDKNDKLLIDEHIYSIDQEAMVSFLNEVVKIGTENADAFESTKQVLPLCDSGSEIKLAYVKVVANLAFNDDGTVDGEEFAAIYNLMVRNDFADDERVTMRSYMFDVANMVKTEDLISELKEKVPSGSFETTALSLIKDCIYLNYKKSNDLEAWRNCSFIKNLAGSLNITDDKIELLVAVIKNDEDILKLRKTDRELEKSAKDLAAKAAAVGVPIAAVYFSGSVIGLSAAGITSGLATLGMGLGMVGGIGIAVLVGVSAYKAVKFFTSSGDVEACKQREMMIQNIIKNNQKTINYLVGDTNMISAKLFELIESGNADKEQIAKLKRLFAMLNRASSATTGGLIYGAKEQVIAKLPPTLSKAKFDRLTEAPTKLKFRPFVYELYSEKTETKKRSDGTTYEEKVYPINDTLPNESYERVLKILKAVEYLAKD